MIFAGWLIYVVLVVAKILWYQLLLNQRKVLCKKTTNMIQDPTVNQHQHMIFIFISKEI